MTDEALAGLSDDLFFITVLLYALSMLAFAGEQAARRTRLGAETAAAGLAVREATAARTRMMAGAGGPSSTGPAPATPAAPAEPRPSRAGRAGTALAVPPRPTA